MFMLIKNNNRNNDKDNDNNDDHNNNSSNTSDSAYNLRKNIVEKSLKLVT